MAKDLRPLGLTLGVLLQAATALAEPPSNQPPAIPAPNAPVAPAKPASAPKAAAQTTAKPQAKAQPAKTLPNRRQLLAVSPGPSTGQAVAAPAPATQPAKPVVANDKSEPHVAQLKLAPNAAEIQAERKAVPPPPPERGPRDVTPKQDPRVPTHVDYTAGPSSSVGANTAGDRKATLIDASGPQQGVIRNRW